jgi:hypothetical protein
VRVASRFICPITLRPANGKTPFVAIKGCGHVVSEQSLKQVGGDICVVCSMSYQKCEVVPLYPGQEVVAKRRGALEEKRAEEKAARDALKAAGGEVRKEKRSESGDDKESKAAKKARLEALLSGGAGSKVGQINVTLGNTITKSGLSAFVKVCPLAGGCPSHAIHCRARPSANGCGDPMPALTGSSAHANKTKEDPVYASMFKREDGTEAKNSYDAAWGQGAMAGVLGGR